MTPIELVDNYIAELEKLLENHPEKAEKINFAITTLGQLSVDMIDTTAGQK